MKRAFARDAPLPESESLESPASLVHSEDANMI